MAEINLAAHTGRPTGSRSSGRLRAEGRIPGVVYGHGGDPVPVSVAWKELRQALTTDAGLNALINLEVDGSRELTIVKELQRHPVRRDVIHVDFLRISRDEVITVEVPVVLHGEAEEVEKADGVVEHVLHSLEITAKPGAIPTEIPVDISTLELGHTIRVADLDLPAGVGTEIDPEEPVVTARMSAVSLEVEELEAEAEAEVEAAEAEAGGEGEAAEGEAGDREPGPGADTGE